MGGLSLCQVVWDVPRWLFGMDPRKGSIFAAGMGMLRCSCLEQLGFLPPLHVRR